MKADRSSRTETAPSSMPLLVYRDRIGVPSEVQFLRRQYIGFTRLSPVWIGRYVSPAAAQLGGRVLRLGGDGLSGWVSRISFRHFGQVLLAPTGRVAPVLHAQFARGGALGLPLAKTLGLRLLVTLHGGDVAKDKNWHATMQARRWPAVVREAVRFVCVSASVAEIAVRRGVPREKIVVLPIGVEVMDVPPRGPVSPPEFLFVGRFVPKKGIDVLSRAIRLLGATGEPVRVVFVGDGPQRGIVEALAREGCSVELAGWLPPDAVALRMARAWALVVPSVVTADGDAEGLPSVIPEAMALGCPVIGSAEGGIAEAIDEGQTGHLVAPGDPEALAHAMRRLLSDPLLRNDLGRAAFAAAQARFNARIQSVALENLLLEVGDAECVALPD